MESFNRRETTLLLAGLGQIYFEFDPTQKSLRFNDTLSHGLAVKLPNAFIDLDSWLLRIFEFDRHLFERFLSLPMREPTESNDFRLKLDTGEYIWMRAIGLKKVNEAETKICGFFKDITSEKFFQFLDGVEMEAMSLSIKDEFDLGEVVDLYLKRLQNFFPGMMATVLKVKNEKVYNFASPNRLNEFALSFSGFPIGPMEGSCGAAAYTGLPVIVEDVFTDPRWEKFKAAAVKYNFVSCWSQSIFDSLGGVIATFAIYSEVKRRPTVLEQNAISRSQQLLSLLFAKNSHFNTIRQNEIRNKYINMAANDAIYEWDAVENKLLWGESFGRLFGYEDYNDRSIDFKEWINLIHPEDRSSRLFALRSAFFNRNQEQWEFEYRFKKVDGSYAFIKEVAFLLRDFSGKVIKLYGVLRDQTESSKFMLIRKSQADLSEIFRSSSGLRILIPQVLEYLSKLGNFSNGEFWQLDEANQLLELLYTYHFDEAARLFAIDSSDKNTFEKGEGLPGKTWQHGYPLIFNDLKNHPDFVRGDSAKKASLESAFGFPVVNAGKLKGVILFTSKVKIRYGDPNIEVLFFLGEFLGSEIARKQQEEEKMLLFKSSPDIMGAINRQGVILSANPAFADLLGHHESQVIGRHFLEFMHPDDFEFGKQLFEAIFNQVGKSPLTELRCKTAIGDYRWISWGASKPYGKDGYVFLYGRDIHEKIINRQALIQSEDKLKNQNMALREIAWVQSHVVRAPLARLMGLVNLLVDQENSLEDQAIYYQYIKESANELDAVIKDVVEKTQGLENGPEPDA